MDEKILTVAELQYVIDKMSFYRRTSGYIGETPDGKLEFFDSKPSFVCAFVTKVVLERSLKNKLFDNEK